MARKKHQRNIELKNTDGPLHIEGPGVIVNMEMLTDSEGREVTRVDVQADGARYALDEPHDQWWCADAGNVLSPSGIAVRIVKGIDKPTENATKTLIMEQVVAALDAVLKTYQHVMPKDQYELRCMWLEQAKEALA